MYVTMSLALFALTAHLFGAGLTMKPESLLTEVVLHGTVPQLTVGFLKNETDQIVKIDSLKLVESSNGINPDSLRQNTIRIGGVGYSIRSHLRDSVWMSDPSEEEVIIKPGDSVTIGNSFIHVGEGPFRYKFYEPTDYYTDPTLTHFWLHVKLWYGNSTLSAWFSGDSSSNEDEEVSIIERKVPLRASTEEVGVYNLKGQLLSPMQRDLNSIPLGTGLYLQRNNTSSYKALLKNSPKN